MAAADGDLIGLSRVRIVSPQRRVDLALPSDVPLADLLPTLLGLAGNQLADDPQARDGWSLARLAGAPLDIARTLGQLEVRDGELLYLRPRQEAAPEPVFDDVAEAIAAAGSRPGRWSADVTRRFGAGLAALSLTGGAVATALAAPTPVAGAALGLVSALGLLVLARATNHPVAGPALALPATAYAFAGGLLLLAGDRRAGDLSGPHMLAGGVAALLVSVLAMVLVDGGDRELPAAGVIAAGLVAGGAVAVTGAGAAGVASAVAGAALVALPATPLAAIRLAGVPVPSLPATPDELRSDDGAVSGAHVLAQTKIADNLLAGMLAGVAALVAGAAVTLALAGTAPALALAAAAGLLLVTRARSVPRTDQRLPLLAAGLVALAAAGVAAGLCADPAPRFATLLLGSAAVAAVSLVLAVSGGRRPRPHWGRAVDIAEVLLAIGVIPLVVWVSGLYGWVHSLASGG
jgi:type VII secretion integral membrane protein EccD